MTTLTDPRAPSFTWPQIESAVLALSDRHITAAATLGLSTESGCALARAQLAIDIRRALEAPRPDPVHVL